MPAPLLKTKIRWRRAAYSETRGGRVVFFSFFFSNTKDVVVAGPNEYQTVTRCHYVAAAPDWEPVLLYSRRSLSVCVFVSAWFACVSVSVSISRSFSLPPALPLFLSRSFSLPPALPLFLSRSLSLPASLPASLPLPLSLSPPPPPLPFSLPLPLPLSPPLPPSLSLSHHFLKHTVRGIR